MKSFMSNRVGEQEWCRTMICSNAHRRWTDISRTPWESYNVMYQMRNAEPN